MTVRTLQEYKGVSSKGKEQVEGGYQLGLECGQGACPKLVRRLPIGTCKGIQEEDRKECARESVSGSIFDMSNMLESSGLSLGAYKHRMAPVLLDLDS